MSLSFLTITGLGLAAIAAAGDTLPWNVPRVLEPVISTSSFKAAYEIGTWLNPFYLRGDFDGDGLPDYALLVIHRGDGKKGIVVWLSSRAKSGLAVVGAGTEFGAGGGHSDNWDFFDAWQVYEKRTAGQVAGQGQRPKGEAIWLDHSGPWRTMWGTQARVSTLLTRVGRPQRPLSVMWIPFMG